MRTQAEKRSSRLGALVVDDEPLARDELRFLLEQCGVEVLGEARNAKEALARFDELSPQVTFVDLRMPGPDGITLAESLHDAIVEIAQSPSTMPSEHSARRREERRVLMIIAAGSPRTCMTPCRWHPRPR